MSFVSNNLAKDEKVLYRAQISPAIFVPSALLGVFLFWLFSRIGSDGLGIVAFLIFIVLLTGPLIRYFTTEFAFTNKRVLAKVGLIGRTSIDLNLRKIESLTLHQGLLGRLFGYGIVRIATAGSAAQTIKGIANPAEVRAKFNEAQELAEQQYVQVQARALAAARAEINT